MSCNPSKAIAQLNPYNKPMTAPRAAAASIVVAIGAITALAGVLAILRMTGLPVGPLNSLSNSLNLNALNFSAACVITVAGSFVFLSSAAWLVKKIFEPHEKSSDPLSTPTPGGVTDTEETTLPETSSDPLPTPTPGGETDTEETTLLETPGNATSQETPPTVTREQITNAAPSNLDALFAGAEIGVVTLRSLEKTDDEVAENNEMILRQAALLAQAYVGEAVQAPQSSPNRDAAGTPPLNQFDAFVQKWSQRFAPVTSEIPTRFTALDDQGKVQLHIQEDHLARPLAEQLSMHSELFLSRMKEQLQNLVVQAEHPSHIAFAVQEMQARLARYNELRAEKGGERLEEPELFTQAEEDGRSWCVLKTLADKPYLTDKDQLEEIAEPHFLADRFKDLAKQIAEKPWVKGCPEILVAQLGQWLKITLSPAQSLDETLRRELIELFRQDQVQLEDVQEVAAFIRAHRLDFLEDFCALSDSCVTSHELTTPLELERFIKVLTTLSDDLPDARSQTWKDFPRLKMKIIEHIHANQMPNHQFRQTERNEDAFALETIPAYLAMIATKLGIDEIRIEIENDTSDDEDFAAVLQMEAEEDQIARDAALAAQLYNH